MDLGLSGKVFLVTGAAAFALSPAASYLTGVAIPIEGGLVRSL